MPDQSKSSVSTVSGNNGYVVEVPVPDLLSLQIRLETEPEEQIPSPDDLLALANAVREAAKPQPSVWQEPSFAQDYAKRAHLKIVRDEN